MGMLTTRQGRTFADMPRSTSQTSPRFASLTRCFSPIVVEEKRVCRRDKFLIGHFRVVDASRNAKQICQNFPLLGIGKRREIFNDVLSSGRHGRIIREVMSSSKFRGLQRWNAAVPAAGPAASFDLPRHESTTVLWTQNSASVTRVALGTTPASVRCRGRARRLSW